jgi:hypothetical protein
MENIIKELQNQIAALNERLTALENKNKRSSAKLEPAEWRTNFGVYKKELDLAFKTLSLDTNFIAEQERFNPNLDIKLSMEKAVVNFWGTEAGWKYKKKSRTNDLDWKRTLTNAIDMNKVYKQKGQLNNPSTMVY